MITLPGVAVSIILFLARRASLGNHSLFLFQRGNVEGTALGEKKISLLSFDLFACLENEEKKKKKNAKSRSLQHWNLSPTISCTAQKKLLTEPSGSCDHSFSILESKGHSLKAVYILYILLSHESKRKQTTAKKRNKHTLLRVIPTMTLSICYWHIFWHSIWHIFWHSTWHIFWHMFWHIFWHMFWHIFWHIF